jgi:hypothetical protein
MSDLAVVGVALDTSQVERGEKIVVQAFGNMAAAREKETAAAGRATTALRLDSSARDQLFAQLDREQRLLDEVAAHQENATRARKASTASLFEHRDAAYRETVTFVENLKVQEQLAASTKTVTAAKTAASAGTNRLASSMTTLALSASGIPGPLGRVASTLGLMAGGGALVVGVTAGIALIGGAYDALTGPARRAREETDKLIESLNKAYRARVGLDLAPNIAATGKALNATASEIEKLQAKIARLPEQVATRTGLVANSERAGLVKQVETLTDRLVEQGGAYAEAVDRLGKFRRANEEAEPPVVKLAKGQKALNDEIERNLDLIRQITQGINSGANPALVPTLSSVNGLSYAEQVRKAARDRVTGSTLLKPPEMAEWGAAGETAASRTSVAFKEAARNIQREMSGVFEGLITGAPDLGQRFGQAFAAGASGVLAAALTDSLKKEFESLGVLTQTKLKNVAKVAAVGVGAYSIGQSSGSVGLGAVSGVAAGAAVGGPVGAIVGGVAGLVGGLTGSAQKAKEAARQMEEARKAFATSLKSYTDEAFGTATSLSRAIDANDAKAEELRRGARAVVPEFDGYKNLDAFLAGLTEYGDELGKIDAAQRKVNDNLRAEEQVRLDMIALSLTEREANLAGNDEAALRARAAREDAEVQRQLRNGEITQAIATRTSAVIEGELNKSIASLGDAARDATASLSESLITRELQARARLASSDAETQAIEDQIRAEQQRIEVEQAVKDGIDATVIASLQRIQGLEDEAVAMERARRAEEDRLRILKESAQYLDDLKARELRATGQSLSSARGIRRNWRKRRSTAPTTSWKRSAFRGWSGRTATCSAARNRRPSSPRRPRVPPSRRSCRTAAPA